jgi:hypothetical protein
MRTDGEHPAERSNVHARRIYRVAVWRGSQTRASTTSATAVIKKTP